MPKLTAIVVGTLAASLASATTTPAHAEPAAPQEAFHADFEIDPTAYVLSGFSLHVGLGWRKFRLDLGNYAMALPQFLHGSDDFDASFSGYGAKLQWFPFAEQRGLFVGVDAGVTRARFDRKDSDLSARQVTLGAGAQVGYRLPLAAGFYATGWIGVSYGFGSEDVTLGGATFESNPITVFPAIHLGYQFR